MKLKESKLKRNKTREKKLSKNYHFETNTHIQRKNPNESHINYFFLFHSTILSIFMCVFVSPVDPLVYIISRLITFLFLLFIHSLELVDVASGVQQWSKSGTKTKKNLTKC